jgi:hypothetical protein
MYLPSTTRTVLSIPRTNIEKSKYLFNALCAAIILFVLIVQRWGPQRAITKSINVWFETVKSGAATAIWIWLVIVRSQFYSLFSSSFSSLNVFL